MADFGGFDAHKLAMAVMMGRSDEALGMLKQLDLGTIAELVERAGVSASAEELHQAIAGSASMGELLDKVEKSTGLGLSDLAGLASGLMDRRGEGSGQGRSGGGSSLAAGGSALRELVELPDGPERDVNEPTL